MIDFQNVSFSYGEESSGGGIRNVNLTINTGEFVLLTGESGCGKTTITRLVNGLVPHYYEGNLEGDVLLDGKSVSDTPLYDLAAMVGSVFQNPKSQFFNVDTDSELAFACENLGYPQEDILKRIDRTVSDYHIEDLMGRSVFALSGGEKQKIACASSSVLLPGIMVLDEPSSNLDMAAIDDLRQVLSLWKKQGKTILIAEHRLYYLHDLADRVLYVKDGEIEREYTPAEFDSLSDSTRKEMGLRPFSLSKLKPANQYQAHTAKLMEFQNFCFAYKKREPESLHIPSAELPVGETIAIIGLNGAGKSTLARCICGLEKKCGLLQVDGKTLAMVTGLVGGLLADVILKKADYKSAKSTVLSCGVFSIWVFGNFAPIFLNRESYMVMLTEGYGAEYAATLNTYMPMWIAPILLVACFVFGLVGGVIGKAICKKHFQRAGIA